MGKEVKSFRSFAGREKMGISEGGEGFRVFQPEELKLSLGPATVGRLADDLLKFWPEYECGLDLITVRLDNAREVVFCFTAGFDQPGRLVRDSREEVLECLRRSGNEALNPIIKDYGLRLKVSCGCEFCFINRAGGALVALPGQTGFSFCEREDFLYLPLATSGVVEEKNWVVDPEIKRRLGLGLSLFTFIQRKGTAKTVLRPVISSGTERQILEVLAEEDLVTARSFISRIWKVNDHARKEIFATRICYLRPKLARLGLGIEFSEGDYFLSLLSHWPQEEVFQPFLC